MLCPKNIALLDSLVVPLNIIINNLMDQTGSIKVPWLGFEVEGSRNRSGFIEMVGA